MERKSVEQVAPDSPRARLLKNFKIAVTEFEPHFPASKKCISAVELYEQRKHQWSTLKRTELTDQDFIKDWMTVAQVPPYYALEIGMALGELEAMGNKD